MTLNGTDLRAFAADELRKVVGLCEQDAHVFDSTLEANLRLAKPEATEDELRDALDRARLLAWTDSLPHGLGTPVGEHGARLSGGQRQRLALARVLLADFPVVILDEPAEHLDEETADELTRDLLGAVAGRTVLLITHRPVDPATVDQVLRLTDGRLAAVDLVPVQTRTAGHRIVDRDNALPIRRRGSAPSAPPTTACPPSSPDSTPTACASSPTPRTGPSPTCSPTWAAARRSSRSSSRRA